MLTKQQLEEYWTKGFVVAPGLISTEEVTALSDAVDHFVEESRKISAHDDVFDLEPTHTAEAPRLRRLKNPQNLHPAFAGMLHQDRIVSALVQILGPAVRLYTGTQKVNLKLGGGGAPVNWHQDWASYPHTNDSLVGVSIFIDEVTPDNGPILAVPGTHKGPVYSHYNDKGVFVNAIDAKKSGLDLSSAQAMTGPAGSVGFHHVRAVHGSVQNKSGGSRRLLIYEFVAADAWPLSGTYTPRIVGPKEQESISLEDYDKRIITGEVCHTPRLEKVPVSLPHPMAEHSGSIYEVQRDFKGGIDKDFEKS